MIKLRVGKSRTAALRRAARKLEDRFLAAQGRRAVREKVTRAGKVTRKAAKAGLIAGTLVAVGVVGREIRKRRKAG